jgi:hypothetical protein
VSNAIEYGIFNLGNGNHWRYKKNDIIYLDSSINVEPYYFCIRIPCNSDEIHIDGELIGNILEVTIVFYDVKVTENLFYQGKIDSSNITLSLNETYVDRSNGVAITLDWSVIKELNNFAGFKIFHNPSLSYQKFYPIIKNNTEEKAESNLPELIWE